jgi:hypothetical protein
MSIDARFRQTVGQFATGVTVIATEADGRSGDDRHSFTSLARSAAGAVLRRQDGPLGAHLRDATGFP